MKHSLFIDPASFESLMLKENTYPCYNLLKNTSEINSVAYSFCGKFIAIGSNDKIIKVWNIE